MKKARNFQITNPSVHLSSQLEKKISLFQAGLDAPRSISFSFSFDVGCGSPLVPDLRTGVGGNEEAISSKIKQFLSGSHKNSMDQFTSSTEFLLRPETHATTFSCLNAQPYKTKPESYTWNFSRVSRFLVAHNQSYATQPLLVTVAELGALNIFKR